ncbi:MAG: right-handed parallel beta-helix repeat-containing protein, partial [Deltaproteobacteria bacterium]|nr:right-handed parallel beta-helix repeat-containing protein [Deltaproteobacteria bacterium]MBW2535475.1 right-handed parallel beta-helix repeat-containing protein [Deltaproteobacteria bacterium]
MQRRSPKCLGRCLPAAALAILSTPAGAATLYVDPSLPSDCSSSYDPSSRACGGGSDTAYASLSAAASAAAPGDTVLLREGSYGERLVPQSSGAAGQPITYSVHAGETATLTGLGEPAIFIAALSYIVVEGLQVDDALGWGRLEDADHITIRDNVFTQATATGTTGGFKLVRSNHNVLRGNRFEDGNDNVVVQESDHNLLEDNVFYRGRHSLLSVRCGDFNVIRGNRFDNPDQKSAEIYDCEGVSDAPYELDATKHNLFDRNQFVFTLGSDMPHRYNGIQYAGQQGIVRRNLFFDNEGGGLGVQVYSDEALHNYGHRIYNNTFVENRCFGLFASNDDEPTRYYDVRVENGLFYGNADCSGGGEQVSIGNTTAVELADNELATSDPGFVDVAGRDLRLTESSPMVDAARFVTRTVGAGSGTELAVEDGGYFYDGYGIEGETGDEIQLEGQTETARVVGIDYDAHLLSLDRSLTWTDGAGVHLAFAGAAPDMGALEIGEEIGPGGAGGTGTGGSGAAAGSG